MRPATPRLASALLLSSLAFSCGAAPTGTGPAALLLTGGKVHTPGGIAEAMAVDADGVILAVGSASEVSALKTGSTRVVELAGASVLPGFHDVHVHPVFGGILEKQCKIAQGAALEAIQARVKECVAKAAPGEWITGGQWDASAIGRIPDRSMLDAVAPRNPVWLHDTSGHSTWANSKALEAAGISGKTPDPAGGIIERDARGEPTGIQRETANGLIQAHVPPPSAEHTQAALEWALQNMLSYGITSFTEASLGFSAGLPREAGVWRTVADQGKLKQRARLCLTWAPGNAEAESVIAGRNAYTRERLSPDCVKIFLDGVPTDSHTAAMLDDYAGTVEGRNDEAARKGLLLVPQAQLDEAVTRFDSMGLTVKFHAAGDAAVRAGLHAVEAARKANGFSTLSHNVGHCTFVAKEDLSIARRVGAAFEISPYLWDPSPINDDITKAIGPERIRRVWPAREMIDAGALVVPGSDWAVVPSVNPWIAVETLVTRENPGGSSRSFGKEQAITVAEAIRLFTENAARHEGSEDKLGRIEPGMLADLVVVDQDPYAVAANRLAQTKVLKTIINGEIVYESAAP
jgi:predicted amidohydrolase YtcJ